MANQFVNIPVPTSNATGAAVDVSSMGKTKTLVIGGGFHATVNVDFSTDAAGADWAPLATFQGPGNLTVDVAAQWIRARTSSYQSGTPNLDIGSDDSGSVFVILTADGAGVDVSALPLFKTVAVPADFVGTVDVSEDGTSWAQAFSFQVGAPIWQSRDIVAQYARVTGSVDGTPVDVTIAGAAGGSGGGSSAQPNLYNALHFSWPDDWLMGSQLAVGTGGTASQSARRNTASASRARTPRSRLSPDRSA